MRGIVSLNSDKKVYLNVYDLSPNNVYMIPFGLGMFHSGLVVHNKEYTFASGGGVFYTEPKYANGAVYRETIDLGIYSGTSRDLDAIIDELKRDFRGEDYNLLLKNCNHFADALCQKLLNKEIPTHINRLAQCGSFFSCLFPPQISNQAPVDNQVSSSSSSSAGHVYRSSNNRTSFGSTASTSGSGNNASYFQGKGNKLGSNNAGGSDVAMSDMDRQKIREARLSSI